MARITQEREWDQFFSSLLNKNILRSCRKLSTHLFPILAAAGLRSGALSFVELGRSFVLQDSLHNLIVKQCRIVNSKATQIAIATHKSVSFTRLIKLLPRLVKQIPLTTELHPSKFWKHLKMLNFSQPGDSSFFRAQNATSRSVLRKRALT